MATTDDHARALGMVRLTTNGAGREWFVRFDEVAAVEDRGDANGGGAVWLRTGYAATVGESAAEVLRLLAEAREHSQELPGMDLDPAEWLLRRASAAVACLADYCDTHDFGDTAQAFEDIRGALRVLGCDTERLRDEWRADR